MDKRNKMNDHKKHRWVEGHYNLNGLGKIFFFVCCFLLCMIGIIFFKDYNSEWRFYQKKFRDIEVSQTRENLTKENQKLSTSQDYLNSKASLKKGTQALYRSEKELHTLAIDLKKAQSRTTKDLAAYQSIKSQYGALKYQLGAVSSSYSLGNLRSLKNKFAKLEHKKEMLKRKYELSHKQEDALIQQWDTLHMNFKKCQKNLNNIVSQQKILQKQLTTVDSKAMTVPNKVASFVRDLPVLDMLNPYYKIDQIVVKEMKDDLHFTEVPIVDRCTSCHKGILKKGYENVENPYKTHPNLDLYLSSNSSHPIDKFACTVCHRGNGRGTSFQSSAHTPNSPEQKKEWKHKYHWHKQHHCERPMLPLRHIQASCYQCHSQSTGLKHAEKLNLGLKIMEQARCYACHKMDKFKDYPYPPAPNLTNMKSKLTQDQWLYHWIHKPQSLRHNTRMPAYFGLSNNSDADSLERSKQEVLAIKRYLYEKATSYSMENIPVKGDHLRGEELISSLGCYACHNMSSFSNDKKTLTMNNLLRQHGPNLLDLGSKTNAQWLYNWLKNPSKYHSKTLMPNMRLSDQEASDITAFLMGKENWKLKTKKVPQVKPPLLKEITNDFMCQKLSLKETEEKIKTMTMDDQLLYAGEHLVSRYGCSSCHQINGVESIPIGAELNKIGDKPLHQMDFGFLSIPHTKYDWFFHKMKEPRIFDKGKVLNSMDHLIMPRYNFTDEEVDAVVTALMGMVKVSSSSRILPNIPNQSFIHKGQQLINKMNCRSCHLIDGEGAAVQLTVEDWLIKFKKKSKQEANAVSVSYSPPNLIGEGRKVQSEWLFNFLHEPSTIRPWLKMRMPSYKLTQNELNSLVSYFSYLDSNGSPFAVKDPFVDKALFDAGKTLFSPDYFDCGNCHIQGDIFPNGSSDRWAPDFSLAKKRLKKQWIIDWMYDPQKLLPGTKMPTYFDSEYFDMSGPDDILEGDEHKHILALTEYVIHGSTHKEKKKSALSSDTKD